MAELAELGEAPGSVSIPEEPAQDLSDDYVERTISQAVSKIPASKYLESEDKPEKKTAVKKSAPKAAPTASDPYEEDADKEEPKEGEEDQEPEPEQEGEEDQEDAKEARTNAKWKEYRGAYRRESKYKATIADLERKLAAASDQTPITTLREQLQRLAQERDELTHAVEVGNVEESRQWKNEVVAPLNYMWEDVQEIAKRNNVDPNKLADLIVHGDDRGIEDFLSDAGPGERNRAFGMINDVRRIERVKQQLRKNARDLGESDRAQQMAQRDAYFSQIKQVRQSAVERIRPKIEERVLALIPKDKRVDLKTVADSITDYDSWKEDTKMYGGFAAIVLPDLIDSFKELRSRYREARDELIKLRGGTPRLTTGSPTGKKRTSSSGEIGDDGVDEDSELKKPIREFAMGATRRLQAAMGMRSR